MGYIQEIIMSAERSPFFHVQEGYYPDPAIQEEYQSSIERHLDRMAREEEKNSKFMKYTMVILGVVIFVLCIIISVF